MPKFKQRKLKRDIVVSIMPHGEKVGIYLEDEPNNLLAEMSPTKANKIIKLWNSKEI